MVLHFFTMLVQLSSSIISDKCVIVHHFFGLLCVVTQDTSHIQVYWRPLAHSASALVFLSRRTDMPLLYHTSLAKLNYDAGRFKVS